MKTFEDGTPIPEDLYDDIPDEYVEAFKADKYKHMLMFDCGHADEIEAAVKARKRKVGGSVKKAVRWDLVNRIKAEGAAEYTNRKLSETRRAREAKIAHLKAQVEKNNKKRGYALTDEELRGIRKEEVARARAMLGLAPRAPAEPIAQRIPQ